MKKARNWAGGAAAVMLVLTLLAVFLLQFINNARMSTFRPLQDDLHRQITARSQSVGDNPIESRLQEAQVLTPRQSESPEAVAETSDVRQNGGSGLTSLARTLTRDDLIYLFRPGTNPMENAYETLLGKSLKIKDSLSWAVGAVDNGETALHIGLLALSRGDIDEARDYLRAALEANIRSGDLSLRKFICARLAWAEDDPEVAASLLEASVTATRPIDEESLPSYVQDALVLSIFTGSGPLAEHYYARWDALAPDEKHIVNLHLERGRSEQIDSWFDEHHPDFYETSTRWDPAQKREENGAKRVG